MPRTWAAGYFTKHSPTEYCCVVCGEIHAGAWARQDARQCCHDKKPLTLISQFLDRDLSKLNCNVQRKGAGYSPAARRPGDGIQRPDGQGHWYRGKDEKLIRQAAYNKALSAAERKENAELKGAIGQLLDADGAERPAWPHKTSPLQRLSFAFWHGNWQQVKDAAIALAYDSHVQKMIDGYRARILDLDGFIRDLETDQFMDELNEGGNHDD